MTEERVPPTEFPEAPSPIEAPLVLPDQALSLYNTMVKAGPVKQAFEAHLGYGAVPGVEAFTSSSGADYDAVARVLAFLGGLGDALWALRRSTPVHRQKDWTEEERKEQEAAEIRAGAPPDRALDPLHQNPVPGQRGAKYRKKAEA